LSGDVLFELVETTRPAVLVTVARVLVEELLVDEVSSEPPPSALIRMVTKDSRSGIERHAQVNASFWL